MPIMKAIVAPITIVKNIGLVIKDSNVYNALICSVKPSILSASINPMIIPGLLNLYIFAIQPTIVNTPSIAKSSHPPVYLVHAHTINRNMIGK